MSDAVATAARVGDGMSKKWYVVHAYSGFEKSVQRTLLEQVLLAYEYAKLDRALTDFEIAGWV